MTPMHRPALAVLFAISGGLPAVAQDRSPAADNATATSPAPAALTGKERLGRKWMDEQRIDNCKVPPEKQGARPRSSLCPHIPTG